MEFIGAATGTTSVTVPAHQAGDLLIAWAYRDGNTTAPTLPSGWTNINNAGASSNSARLAYRVATGSGTASGTWTNATGLIIAVYRGAILGAFAVNAGTAASVGYPALAMTNDGGTSWVLGFAGHRSVNTSLQTPPAGMTNRVNGLDSTDHVVLHDTNGGVAAWSASNVAVGGTASGWRTATVELRDAANRYLVRDASGLRVATMGDALDLSAPGFLAKNAPPANLTAGLRLLVPGFRVPAGGGGGTPVPVSGRVAIGADDGTYFPGEGIYPTVNGFWPGRKGMHWVRTPLDVPQGSTIQEAFLTLTGYDSSPVGGQVAVYAIAADAPTSPTTTGQADTLDAQRTTASVAWAFGAVSAGSVHKSPDLKAVLQEIVNRPGWPSTGGYVLWWLVSTGTVEVTFRTFEYGVLTDRPLAEAVYLA